MRGLPQLSPGRIWSNHMVKDSQRLNKDSSNRGQRLVIVCPGASQCLTKHQQKMNSDGKLPVATQAARRQCASADVQTCSQQRLGLHLSDRSFDQRLIAIRGGAPAHKAREELGGCLLVEGGLRLRKDPDEGRSQGGGGDPPRGGGTPPEEEGPPPRRGDPPRGGGTPPEEGGWQTAQGSRHRKEPSEDGGWQASTPPGGRGGRADSFARLKQRKEGYFHRFQKGTSPTHSPSTGGGWG